MIQVYFRITNLSAGQDKFPNISKTFVVQIFQLSSIPNYYYSMICLIIIVVKILPLLTVLKSPSSA